MPCISGNYDPSVGIYLPVILVPQGLLQTGSTLNGPDIFPGGIVRPFKAQIDTGAQSTCITKKAIEFYGMQPNGRVELVSVSGTEEVNTYIFTIGFLNGAIPNRVGPGSSANFSFFPPITGAEIYTHEDDDLEILIGMDVISRGSLHIEASGFFSFWY